MVVRVGNVAYQLDLLEELSEIHSTFPVSKRSNILVDDLEVVLLDGI